MPNIYSIDETPFTTIQGILNYNPSGVLEVE